MIEPELISQTWLLSNYAATAFFIYGIIIFNMRDNNDMHAFVALDYNAIQCNSVMPQLLSSTKLFYFHMCSCFGIKVEMHAVENGANIKESQWRCKFLHFLKHQLLTKFKGSLKSIHSNKSREAFLDFVLPKSLKFSL